MSQRGYLTPDAIPAGTTCRTILIPDDEGIIAQVYGAITELSKDYNWEQFGAVTPTEMAARMWQMAQEFIISECEANMSFPVVILKDEKTQNTNGGTANSGAWQTRTLNQLLDPAELGVTLVDNEFTLPAGTWFIRWSCPAFDVGNHQSRLFRLVDASAVAWGSSGTSFGANNLQIDSHGMTYQVLASPTTYRIEHQVQTSVATTGFGRASNFATEVYTQVEIRPILPS